MPPTSLGLITGLLLGFAWLIGGFGGFLVVAVLGGLGLVVGRVVSGQLDLTQYLGGSGRGQR